MYNLFRRLAYAWSMKVRRFVIHLDRRQSHLECKHIVGEHDNFVSSVFVILDEELARLELIWIHAVKQHPLAGLFLEIFMIKFRGHRAPDFRALGANTLEQAGFVSMERPT